MESNLFAFSAYNQGYNHIKDNKPCEDNADFYGIGRPFICAVADGHGSDNYPRAKRGAEYAVNSAISCILSLDDAVHTDNICIEDILEDSDHNYAILTQLAKSILNEWYKAVDKDYSNDPFKPEELKNVSSKYRRRYLSDDPNVRKIEKAYGCTLIAYAVTEDYSFGLQIGDGKCVLIQEDGTCIEPIPWDDNCQLNITTSICDEDAIDEFRFYVSDTFPLAVFCGSDGIDDSYSNQSELYELYRSMLKIFVDYGIEIGKKEIIDYLPVLTRKGSGDDVSIGLIIDLEKARKNRKKLDIQTGIFKAEEQLSQIAHKIEVAMEMKSKTDPGSLSFLRYEKQLSSLRSDQEQLNVNISNLHRQLVAKNDSFDLSTALMVIDADKKYEMVPWTKAELLHIADNI